jgi:hypothetical protein
MMTYNENINYKKEFAKIVKEIKKNKPKKTRQEREYEKFSEQLDKSIELDGMIEQPVISNWGVISGNERLKHIKGLPIDTRELYTKETADKFGLKWIEVKDQDEFHRKRVTCAYLRKEGRLRSEILDYARSLEGKMPINQIANYVVDKLKGVIYKQRIYEYLPKEYKTSSQCGLPEGMNMLQKPQTVTFSIRTTRSQKERFYELCKKHGLQVNDVVKQLLDEWIKKMTSTDSCSGQETIEQQPQEIRETIQHAQEILENKQEEPKIIEYQPSKFDYCNDCHKTTKHIWNSFTQSYMCGECYAKEMNKVTNQSPARMVIGKRE